VAYYFIDLRFCFLNLAGSQNFYHVLTVGLEVLLPRPKAHAHADTLGR
jgi:hypothetical protein